MDFLLVLLILLAATRFCGEISIRLGQPAMVGELVAGILLAALIGWIGAAAGEPLRLEVPRSIIHLAIFFLALLAGVEMRPKELVEASGASFVIALCGAALPFCLGFGLGWIALPDSAVKITQCLFIGTALSITAVPVAVRILLDMGKLHTRVGETIVTAAIFDDIFGLVLLAILTAVIQGGEPPSGAALLTLAGELALFFAVVVAAGIFVFPLVGRWLGRLHSAEVDFTVVLIAALGFAVLAEALDIHFILGAFAAGLFLGPHAIGEARYDRIRHAVAVVTLGFLGPVFFASIGLRAELDALIAAPVFTIVLVLIAMAGKMAGAGLPALALGHTRSSATAIGLGMSVRGAVALVVADVALEAGLFRTPAGAPLVGAIFSAVVLMALVTTLVPAALLPSVLRRVPDGALPGAKRGRSRRGHG